MDTQVNNVETSEVAITIYSLRLFEDNFSYIIENPAGGKKELALVDPAEPDKVLYRLQQNFPEHIVIAVLYTHQHWDHAGNSDALKTTLLKEGLLSKDAQFILSEVDSQDMNVINKPIPSGSSPYKLDIFPGVSVSAYIVPCHTQGHTTKATQEFSFNGLRVDEKNDKSLQLQEDFFKYSCDRLVFTGDTIFVGGCGRFFEGNAEDMHQNFKIFKSLPPDTNVFCGHQYAIENLNWAAHVQFENPDLLKKLAWMKKRAGEKLPSIPSTVFQQNTTNVFLRFDNPWLKEKLKINDEIEVLNKLRTMKNQKETLTPLL